MAIPWGPFSSEPLSKGLSSLAPLLWQSALAPCPQSSCADRAKRPSTLDSSLSGSTFPMPLAASFLENFLINHSHLKPCLRVCFQITQPQAAMRSVPLIFPFQRQGN